MERTVPRTSSEEVELYLRTYTSLLRTTAEVRIRTLEEVHAGMKSLLHRSAREPTLDMSAFLYALSRLPGCMPEVRLVVLGQSVEVFARTGFGDVQRWEQVSAQARRRRCFFDGAETLACLIASRSDIDDVVPLLTAFQIEWNKLHRLLQPAPVRAIIDRLGEDPAALPELAEALGAGLDEVERWQGRAGIGFGDLLRKIAVAPRNLAVRLLSGSLSAYRRATSAWWAHIEHTCPELRDRPVYFVSSNTHSLLNLISGFALNARQTLIDFVGLPENQELFREWQDIQARQVQSSEQNFLYYVLRKYQGTHQKRDLRAEQQAIERQMGILRIPSEGYFDVEAQIVYLARLDAQRVDDRALPDDLTPLLRSDALILNIDYPLGLAAYNILTEVAENVREILGVYVMGKAATLNGVLGDVMISNVVHDEHSQNTYLFGNCFNAADVSPYLAYGSVLDNQKAVSVLGTFLQNDRYMEVFYREGYTDIEMEAGPYLSAVYEMYRPQRHPVNEIVNLYGLPFDLGIIHYASDTPLKWGRSLGAGSLSYFGMDSTYACSVAILRRILCRELARTS